MDAGAEGDVVVRPAREIELLGRGVCRRIHVGRRQHGHDLVATLEPDAAQVHICRTKRGLENCTGETKRRNSSTARPTRVQSCASQSRSPGFLASSSTDPLMR